MLPPHLLALGLSFPLLHWLRRLSFSSQRCIVGSWKTLHGSLTSLTLLTSSVISLSYLSFFGGLKGSSLVSQIEAGPRG